MGKRIEIDGMFYRERRGKMVEIPTKWVGHVTSRETIRQRPSKLQRKVRRIVKDVGVGTQYKDKLDLLRSDPDEQS
jgi:hypothetical protein